MRFQPLWMEGPLAELAGHQLRRVGGWAPCRRELRWSCALRGVAEFAHGATEQVVVLLQTVDAVRQLLFLQQRTALRRRFRGFALLEAAATGLQVHVQRGVVQVLLPADVTAQGGWRGTAFQDRVIHEGQT